MKDLIVRILFKADDKAVKSQLKKTEQEAKKAANNIGGSLKKAFGGLAASIAGIGLGRVFKSAIDDAAKLEQSLLKLQAAAKNTGQDFGTIEKGLQRLRSEGTLSFQTITEASQQLLQQGFKADQIEPFLRALRNIGALENTVGDTNLAIQSFIRAISTNSIELVDNLSPALRKTVLELGGFNQIAKDASKQQEFLNITLERGDMFAEAYGDSIQTTAGKQAQFAVETEKLSEAFGQALAPAFEGILGLFEPLIKGTSDFLSNLTSSEKSLVAAGSAATLAATAFTGLAFAIGASATAMTVLTGGLVVAGAALATFALSQSQINEEINTAADTVTDLENKLRRISRIKGNEKEREALTKQLTQAQKDLNDALDDRIAKENRLLGLGSAERKAKMLDIQQQRERLTGLVVKLAGQTGFASGGGRKLTGFEEGFLRSGTVAELEKLREPFFGESAEQAQQPFGTSQKRANAAAKLLEQLINLAKQQEILAEEQAKYNQALKDAKGATDGASKGAQVFSKQAVKVGETVFPTFTEALIDMAGRLDTAAYNVDSMTSAVEVLGDESARTSDKIRGLGEGLRGIGGLLTDVGAAGAGSTFGFAGAGLGLFGAVGGLFDSLFDSSQSQESILNQQLDLQREQFSFAKEQAGIEKKFFEDELEIIRLRAKREGTDPNEALANAITERLRDLGFTEEISIEQLELQRQRLKNESEEILRNKRLLSRAQNLGGGSGGVGQLVADLNQIRREAGLSPLSGDIGTVLNDTIVQLTARTQGRTAQEIQDIQDLLEQGLRLEPPSAPRPGTTLTPPTTLQQVQPRGFSFLDVSRGGLQTALGFAPSRAVEMISGAGVPGQIGSLTVATEAMKTTEEKMLDTLDGQLSELKKQTDILSKLTGQDVTIAVLNAISAGQARSL